MAPGMQLGLGCQKMKHPVSPVGLPPIPPSPCLNPPSPLAIEMLGQSLETAVRRSTANEGYWQSSVDTSWLQRICCGFRIGSACVFNVRSWKFN